MVRLFSAYEDFKLECQMLGYSNNFKDKLEFLHMYFFTDAYDYLDEKD